jgi:glycosyltransferase involved in cell wall biosynthesis
MIKISIVTVVFNRQETIRHALESLLAQTYPNVEVIVIDGGSSDGTLDVLCNLKSSINVLLSEPDSGIYDALNKGFLLATGDVIGILHSDDFYADSRVLDWVANEFLNPNVDAVYGDLDYVSKDDISYIVRRWRSGEYSLKKMLYGWMPPHPTLFLRRSVINRLGLFNSDLRISADYDAILRYFVKGTIYSVYIPRVLVKMRTGGESNKTLKRIWLKTSEDYFALKSNNFGGVLTLLCKNLRKLNQFF